MAFACPWTTASRRLPSTLADGPGWFGMRAFKREKIGDMPTEMFLHFFKSFSDTAKCNLNVKAEGTNEHHKIEAIFKAFAKAIKMAVKTRRLPATQH